VSPPPIACAASCSTCARPALDGPASASALRLYLEETQERFGLGYRLDNRLERNPAGVRVIVYRSRRSDHERTQHASASEVAVTLDAGRGRAR